MSKNKDTNSRKSDYTSPFSFYERPSRPEIKTEGKFKFYSYSEKDGIRYCPYCGEKIQDQENDLINEEILYCPNCGEKLD